MPKLANKPHIDGKVVGASDHGDHAKVDILVGEERMSFEMSTEDIKRYPVGRNIWLELRPAPQPRKKTNGTSETLEAMEAPEAVSEEASASF